MNEAPRRARRTSAEPVEASAGPVGVVFDFGGVLIDWDPEPAVAAGVGPEEARRFFAEFDFGSWNHAQDAGRSWDDALLELEATHPHFLAHGRAYRANFDHALRGEVPGTAQVLRDLHTAGVPLLGLTNWSDELFHGFAPQRFDFLALFEDIVVSGTEGLAKPDPAIYRLAVERIGLPAGQLVFIDDRAENVATARALGMHGIVFTDAETLRTALADLGLLRPPS
ncbi:HAD family phosphatase [Nocardioides sp. BP30]|uniref:HAD family hydrolase n=1 Tax=Nocardioides sp. BP30 TaxID=3036374 RepID=UPI0024685D5E|nr:HAD family phosphatase [Nocardioides sp. BP30]WGL53258.1 HAD family phosphatase [Nocardioides sp. BP30]